MALRWGVVGAGRITHDFVTAVQIFPNDHQVVAVGSGSKENAEKFAKEHNIPKAFEGYQGIATDKDIDIVYIGNLNTQHYETAKLMLEHNKPVLCEKPFTMCQKQTAKLVEIARSKNLFLMEAVWSRCFPAYRELEKRIKNGEIGDVLHASVDFGFALQHVDRLTAKNMGGGAILDLGVYILQFQQFVFRNLKPEKIVVNGHLNQFGTDESAGAIITYPGGKMAVVSTSAKALLSNEGRVVGTKGSLKLPKFWSPTELISSDESRNVQFKLPETEKTFFHVNSAGLYYEAEEARQCLKNGKIESPQMTHAESIELAGLMDLLMKEVGVKFPEELVKV